MAVRHHLHCWSYGDLGRRGHWLVGWLLEDVDVLLAAAKVLVDEVDHLVSELLCDGEAQLLLLPASLFFADGSFGEFQGDASFVAFELPALLPEPSVMFLMLAAGLLVSAKAVLRRNR